jgi:quinol monooxygenase YgiN
MVGPTRKETGCITYDLHESVSEGRRKFSFYEVWRHEADHVAHMKSPHVQVLLTRQSELIEGDILLDRLTLIS